LSFSVGGAPRASARAEAAAAIDVKGFAMRGREAMNADALFWFLSMWSCFGSGETSSSDGGMSWKSSDYHVGGNDANRVLGLGYVFIM
jgi:hypothetical protein